MEKTLIKKHIRILVIIYAILGVMFFVFSYMADNLEKPYQKRNIPMEVTPWLK